MLSSKFPANYPEWETLEDNRMSQYLKHRDINKFKNSSLNVNNDSSSAQGYSVRNYMAHLHDKVYGSKTISEYFSWREAEKKWLWKPVIKK